MRSYCHSILYPPSVSPSDCQLEKFGMKMDLTWKKLLGEGLANQQIETMLLLGVVPIILLTIWFMVFLYNNLAPELEN